MLQLSETTFTFKPECQITIPHEDSRVPAVMFESFDFAGWRITMPVKLARRA